MSSRREFYLSLGRNFTSEDVFFPSEILKKKDFPSFDLLCRDIFRTQIGLPAPSTQLRNSLEMELERPKCTRKNRGQQAESRSSSVEEDEEAEQSWGPRETFCPVCSSIPAERAHLNLLQLLCSLSLRGEAGYCQGMNFVAATFAWGVAEGGLVDTTSDPERKSPEILERVKQNSNGCAECGLLHSSCFSLFLRRGLFSLYDVGPSGMLRMFLKILDSLVSLFLPDLAEEFQLNSGSKAGDGGVKKVKKVMQKLKIKPKSSLQGSCVPSLSAELYAASWFLTLFSADLAQGIGEGVEREEATEAAALILDEFVRKGWPFIFQLSLGLLEKLQSYLKKTGMSRIGGEESLPCARFEKVVASLRKAPVMFLLPPSSLKPYFKELAVRFGEVDERFISELEFLRENDPSCEIGMEGAEASFWVERVEEPRRLVIRRREERKEGRKIKWPSKKHLKKQVESLNEIVRRNSSRIYLRRKDKKENQNNDGSEEKEEVSSSGYSSLPYLNTHSRGYRDTPGIQRK